MRRDHHAATIADELRGRLSPAEADEDRRSSRAVAQAREHYDLMLLLAGKARDQVRNALASGVPRITRPRSGSACIASVHHATVFRLINAFAWANCGLWRAARSVVELEHLPDDGAGHGIVFEVTL